MYVCVVSTYYFAKLIYDFFFNDTVPPEFSTLSLHDALPIFRFAGELGIHPGIVVGRLQHIGLIPWGSSLNSLRERLMWSDRKSTRLNSSHTVNSYAVFCSKKKTNENQRPISGTPTLHPLGPE